MYVCIYVYVEIFFLENHCTGNTNSVRYTVCLPFTSQRSLSDHTCTSAAFLPARPCCCHTDPKGMQFDIPAQGSDAPATAVTQSKHSCHSISSIQEDKTAEQFAKISDIDQIGTRELYETLRHFLELRKKPNKWSRVG